MKTQSEHYFGGCPECGDQDGYLNVGRVHWIVCDTHMAKWCVGSNLFSSWREETEEDWQRNVEKLAGYTKVEPMPWRDPAPGEPKVVSIANLAAMERQQTSVAPPVD